MTITKQVVFVGPESCGKTSLSLWLHNQLPNSIWLPEYTRIYCEKYGVDTDLTDVMNIAKGQLEQEFEAWQKQATYLILDSNLLSNIAWSLSLFNVVDDWIVEAWKNGQHGHYFLGSPAMMQWQEDKQRCQPDFEARNVFFQLCKKLLDDNQLSYSILDGDYQHRQDLITKYLF